MAEYFPSVWELERKAISQMLASSGGAMHVLKPMEPPMSEP
jgi:hypothetical protein